MPERAAVQARGYHFRQRYSQGIQAWLGTGWWTFHEQEANCCEPRKADPQVNDGGLIMFRVFGVTRAQAEASALRKVKRTEGRGKQRKEKTEAKYQAELKKEIEHQLLIARPKQLSHDLSTPGRCREFMKLVKPGEAASLKIMYRAFMGKYTKRGTQVIEWKEWTGDSDVTT
ncbi:TPA: hypothetical protein QD004_002427 [Shewanella algae]|uniref:hypothetical protein n=1 Tax=Shewanella algae TaxID=38313 RepID=UPI001C57C9FF|nr:hypothetical protein [Shewanella algae]HDS1203134.1 hypothetical protein [Shewanella algae]